MGLDQLQMAPLVPHDSLLHFFQLKRAWAWGLRVQA